MGVTAQNSAQTVIEDLSLPITVQEYFELLNQEYNKLFPLVNYLPGVERLLKHLQHHKIPMCIASSSKKESFILKTEKLGQTFTNFFEHILLAPEEALVKKSKPAPDTFLVAQDKFSRKPLKSECLVFEDSVAGAVAGCRAGMQVIWIPDKRLDTNKFIEQEPDLRPTQILSSMLDFCPEDFGLPVFQSNRG
jgi:pseudouridine-5'-monophosphatase